MANTGFTDDQYHEIYPPGIEHYFWHVARHRILYRELRRLTGGTMPPSRVLEIGCGRGIVVRFMRNNGIQYFGTELSPVEVDPDLAPYIEAGCDCFDLPEHVRAKVECLMLLDVIEHLPEPVAFMRRLREAFSGLRSIVVTVPARAELWSSYDTQYGHFRRYTIETVVAELDGAGFVAARARYFFHGLYPIMFGLAKLSGERFTTIATPRRKWLHRVMGGYVAVESLVLPARIWGTSVLCTARTA